MPRHAWVRGALTAHPPPHTHTPLAMRRMVWLSLPLIAQFLATMGLSVMSNISVGHMNDPAALSAALLGSSIFMVTGWSVFMGLSTSQDTLVGAFSGTGTQLTLGQPAHPLTSIPPRHFGPARHAGQAHGARNYELVGLTLQRGILIAWTLCIPMIVLWLLFAPIMSLVGIQGPFVDLTAHYLAMLSPTIFSTAVVTNLQR